MHTWAVGVSFAASVCNVCAKVHRTRPHQEPTLRQDGGHGQYSNTSGERNADGYDYYKLVDESAETSAWQPNVLVRTRWSLSDVERGNGWTEIYAVCTRALAGRGDGVQVQACTWWGT